ncbi:MAG: sigma-70 family RNA polymerase sigma factor [Candidatus Eisenbacteria bacterium]|nr:sigma-70 family RNA polymerase sigma factor [Candidatus Eisenbacteria bacterium]
MKRHPRNPGAEPPDHELVALTAAGDDEAYRLLVERYSDFVYTVVLRIVRNPEDAEDVAQEAFVRAHRSIGRFRGDSKFSSWLYRIAVNRALTHLKRRRRRPQTVEMSVSPRVEAEISSRHGDEDPERAVLDEEFRARVRHAVSKLPPRYRAAVTLFYLEERNYKEVAEVLGIPMGTLKTHLHRARALLRDELLAEEAERGR